MSRYFDNKEIELLAPAGNFEIFKEIIHSGADAVYFGGKILNMRMHRKNFNFTNEEIVDAINMAHALDKKVYITVNNLLSKNDLDDAVEYLKFLNKIQPDALIIQDFSIVELINELGLNLNLHSSVMMNIHNLETINKLKELGITRIVASREMDLKTIEALHNKTNMEFEYFTHGDMCVAHGSQCIYSGMLFGKSSNRGLCMKPCRWDFKIKKDGNKYPTEFPMAVKDMYMYEHIPELIQSGVVSFKIEGRMRGSEYLVKLINQYSDAIDRYISDPFCYDRKKSAENIYENRKRDLSTAFAFGKPGLSYINRRYEGTGKFYSHGKVFSKPIEEFSITEKRINQIKDLLKASRINKDKPLLSVKVNSFEAAKIAIEEGADDIYLSGEVFTPNKPFSKDEILWICNNKKDSKIYLATPKMMYEKDFSEYNHFLNDNSLNLDGLLVTNLGAINKFKNLNLELIGDYSLNIYNYKALNFYEKAGLKAATLSTEAPLLDLKDTVLNSSIPVEMIVQGSPVVMYLEHDLYENLEVYDPVEKEDNDYIKNNILVLKDDKGFEHPVFRDNNKRNHMILYKDLCYLPILKELNSIGVNRFRIEGCHYSDSTLRDVISIYRKALNDLNSCEELYPKVNSNAAGYTLGALQFD